MANAPLSKSNIGHPFPEMMTAQELASVQMERIYATKYDTITYAAGATIQNQDRLFVNNGGKNRVQTNMTADGVLPNPQALHVGALALQFNPDITKQDLDNFVKNTFVQVLVSGKDYWESPAQFIPGGNSSFLSSAVNLGVSAAGTALALAGATNGIPDRANILLLDLPFWIGQGESFEVDFSYTSAINLLGAAEAAPTANALQLGNGLIARFYLIGHLYRQIK